MAIWDRAWMAGDQREERTMWYCTVCALVTFTLSILTTFSVVEAQPTGKVYRIGLLTEGTRMTALLEALRVLGYIDGHNLVLEQRHAERPEQLPAFAAELVTRQVDLIVTVGTPATRAAKQATTTVPIVFTLSADPVQSELVASLARPGVNLTGYTSGVQTGNKTWKSSRRPSQESCAWPACVSQRSDRPLLGPGRGRRAGCLAWSSRLSTCKGLTTSSVSLRRH